MKKKVYMTKFNAPDMSCGHCTTAIEKEIKGADQAADASCDLSERSVAVQSTLGADAILFLKFAHDIERCNRTVCHEWLIKTSLKR